MSGDVTDGPTPGEIYWHGYIDDAGILNFPYSDLDDEARRAIEAGAAAVAATAIARLDQPAQLAAAMTENVKLRKQLDERDAQLADALTPTAADFDHAADIMRLRELLDEIGVLAANAPEDGDSFALLEQIAMMAAHADIPDEPERT